MLNRRIPLWIPAAFLALWSFTAEAAEPAPEDVARRGLAELREKIESTHGCVDEKTSAMLLTANWPDALLPEVRETLAMILRKPGVRLRSSAVAFFAVRNGEDAALLAPHIAAALPEADIGDAVDLLCAVRSIGPRANALEEIVAARCTDRNPIVAIHAASALLRIAPARNYPRGLLLKYLKSDRPGFRWRAADAVAHTGVSDERWLQRLGELLKDDDVCVRVTSAFALWRITNDPAVPLPVLVASLTERDKSLATAFEYPSYRGESHRTYAIDAIMDLGDAGKPALPDIIAVVKQMAGPETKDSDRHAVLGIAALQAIVKLGPVSEKEFEEIEACVECKECAFALLREKARKILSRIRKSLPGKGEKRVQCRGNSCQNSGPG